MTTFSEKINSIKPEHDNPAGLVHPYWARKPLNIIEEIIKYYSKNGETVLDPFMGSGTTIFAAIKNNRNAIGTDLNPISQLLVNSIIESNNSNERFREVLNESTSSWKKFAIELYNTNCGLCAEREIFQVIGEFEFSNFTLSRIEAKLKPINGDNVSGKITISSSFEYKLSEKQLTTNTPIDFSSIEFVENTRIAVHKGVKSSDFFTDRNQAFINFCIDYIESNYTIVEEKEFLKLYLSSMLPLLRLSDKKASSQWPYWRPKEFLTSRNPVVAIKRRFMAFTNLLDWESDNLSSKTCTSKIFDLSADELGQRLNNSPKVDLILTDPPYADHAPYMEYSDFYWSIISGQRTRDLWSKEIVKTNAVGRAKDSNDYENRMKSSFTSVLSILKYNGYFIFFYVDKNLKHWDAIKKAIIDSNCLIEDVIPILKQRRSMKAVTSPGKTLDGDLIIICKKVINKKPQETISLEEAVKSIPEGTYFERFAHFITCYLTKRLTGLESANIKDISRII
ncbi:MAG: DNA modification methylase [Vicingaceae bacterium]|jgi:DNA modification methylase